MYALKRKIRNYVRNGKRKTQKVIKFILKEDVPLNRSDREACESVGIKEKKIRKSQKH